MFAGLEPGFVANCNWAGAVVRTDRHNYMLSSELDSGIIKVQQDNVGWSQPSKGHLDIYKPSTGCLLCVNNNFRIWKTPISLQLQCSWPWPTAGFTFNSNTGNWLWKIQTGLNVNTFPKKTQMDKASMMVMMRWLLPFGGGNPLNMSKLRPHLLFSYWT